jgi:phosphopantothenoylcysteine decarboxylase/phosphopantothenate--cysteine ligase
MRILITAGPTREYIDDVRFLSNASSGRMGAALARAAADAGHTVTLVLGPVRMEPTPPGTTVPVVSADDMRREVLGRAAEADAVIMAAAVADYRPAERTAGKIRKTSDDLTLRLVRTPDILAELGRAKRPGQVLVGFALETENIRENALAKLREKNLDLIVANAPAAIGADSTSVELLFASGNAEPLRDTPKPRAARCIIEAVETLARKKGPADEQR